MGNLSKASFFDAGSNPPPSRAFLVDTTKGKERRLDKYPNGFVERWVDPAGNVVFEQIIPPGVPRSRELYDRMRARIQRRDSGARVWFEHKACCLANGTFEAEDFPAKLQRPCRKGSYGRGTACPHVEFMIAKRQGEHNEARAARHAIANAEKARKDQLERDQAEQTARLNTNIERLVDRVAGDNPPKKRKAKSTTAVVETSFSAPVEPMLEDLDDEPEFDLEDDMSDEGPTAKPAKVITPVKKPRAKAKAKPRKR